MLQPFSATAHASSSGSMPAPPGTPAPMKPGDEAPSGAPGSGEALCSACGGSGRAEGKRCEVCEGTGRVNVGIGGG